ncbi:MAG: TRAP transporter substrate-binding protein [Oscillospiraceae bacterium]
MKKALVTILALVFCLSLMAGCGGTTSGTDSSTATGNTGTSGNTDATKEVYTFTLAHASAEDTTSHLSFVELEKFLEDSGRFDVNLYPNGQLGADREAIEGVQNGDIMMTCTSPAPQANFVPAAMIFDVPFAVMNVDMIRYLENNEDFIDGLRKYYAEKGFYMGYMCDMTFRIMTSRGVEVHTPADLKGFNIRTMENANHMLLWSSLGANPTPIAYTELYTALQQGTVDGQENALELAITQKFYEQQDHANITNHLMHANLAPINLDWYNSLDDEARDIFNEGLIMARDYMHSLVDANQEGYREFCNENGMPINDLTVEELEAFAALTTPVDEKVDGELKAQNCDIYDTFIAAVESYPG